MARRTRSGFRLAVILLFALAVLLLVVLAACPPSAKRPAQEPSARQPTDEKPTQRAPRMQPPAAPPESPQPEVKGRMAVLIDDAGYDLDELEPFLALPIPLAVAVLPNLPHSREAARMVLEAGKELLVHCPMEPEGQEDPGPGALRTTDSPARTRQLLEEALATVPGARGLNNHMGSRATADEELMRRVLGFLGERGMFFVDSRTTAQTIGARVATELGVPFLERDVFIDVANSEQEIAEALSAGIERASRRGTALLIGHVQNPGVLAILRASAPALRDAGVKLSPLSEILDSGSGGSAR